MWREFKSDDSSSPESNDDTKLPLNLSQNEDESDFDILFHGFKNHTRITESFNRLNISSDDDNNVKVDESPGKLIAEPKISSNIFDEHDLPKLENLKKLLLKEKLEESLAMKLINTGAELLKKENNVLYINAPVTVCGDIHGQFIDLLRIFDVGGDAKDTNYLFLGDYVDRGEFGIECILYLWALKIKYPKKIHLLRGNHECRLQTQNFSFKDECLNKYSQSVYDACMLAFDCLPLVAIVNKMFFCVHGGLSPDLDRVEDVDKINRFTEPPKSGLFCDLLWADPSENFFDEKNLFCPNNVRGCSYNYSYRACKEFIKRNKLLSIFRAHEYKEKGFQLYKKSERDFPVIFSVFSAPNYCHRHNTGAVIVFDDTENDGNGSVNIKKFE